MSFVGSAPGRREGTIMMRDGRYINPLQLEDKDLRIPYMLHGLPNVCRFSGSLSGPNHGGILRHIWRWLTNRTSFYSVAQHQVLGARWFLDLGDWDNARWFALHDAIEFAMGDIARPVKYQPEMQFFRDAEKSALEKLANKYGLSWPMPPEIKLMDNRMLATEARDLMNDPPWKELPPSLPFRIEPWTPTRSFVEYRDLLTELGFM